MFQNGQSVYYKRADSPEWKGPGKYGYWEREPDSTRNAWISVCMCSSELTATLKF